MADTIVQIKRSLTSNIPVTLKPGEFAYSSSEANSTGLTNGVLYIGGPTTDQNGNSTNKYVIGGTKYTNLLDVPAGTWTAGKTIVVNQDGKIDKIVTDNIEGPLNTGTNETRLVIGKPDTENQKIVIYDPYLENEEGEIVPVAQYIDELVKGGMITLVAGDGIADITNQNGTYTIALEPTGVTQGTYGSETKVPSFTVNQYGQITNIAEKTISTTMSVTNVEGDETATVNLISGKLIGADGLKVTQAAAGQAQIDVDETVVRTAGAQTINGAKTFGDTIPVTPVEQGLRDDETQLARLSVVQDEIIYTDASATGATIALGGIAKGEKLEDMTMKEIIDKLLHPYVATTNVRLSITPVNGGTFEVGDVKTLTGGTISWTAGSTQVTQAEILKGGSAVGTVAVDSGTSIACSFTDNQSVGSTAGTVTFSSRVKDDKGGKTIPGGSVSFTHVYPYYYGGRADIPAASGDITALSKMIQVKGTKKPSFNLNNEYMVFAYPAAYGNLKSITDPTGNDMTGSFTQTKIQVTGLDGTAQEYNVYTQNNRSTASGYVPSFNI